MACIFKSMSEESKGMSEELKEKLSKDVDEASWELLADHHKRGAVFLVKDLDIVDVGAAMANDDSANVKLMA